MDKSLFSLEGEKILLTGATGHLGRQLATDMAAAGATVLVNGRHAETCEALVAEIAAAGGAAQACPFDVTDEDAVTAFLDTDMAGGISGLINNAYAGAAGTVRTSGASDFQQSFDAAVVSAHRLIAGLIPSLTNAAAQNGNAAVVNISSMYGVVAPRLSVYASPETSNPPQYGVAKAGLIQLTRYAACEFAPQNIRFNAITPGPFPGDAAVTQHPDMIERITQRSPLGRIGHPRELSGAVIFLASRASSYVTGAVIPVDGGWTAW